MKRSILKTLLRGLWSQKLNFITTSPIQIGDLISQTGFVAGIVASVKMSAESLLICETPKPRGSKTVAVGTMATAAYVPSSSRPAHRHYTVCTNAHPKAAPPILQVSNFSTQSATAPSSFSQDETESAPGQQPMRLRSRDPNSHTFTHLPH